MDELTGRPATAIGGSLALFGAAGRAGEIAHAHTKAPACGRPEAPMSTNAVHPINAAWSVPLDAEGRSCKPRRA